MIQHELLLGVVHRTIWTLEDRHFLIRYMLVKVRVEQSLLGKNGVTHGTLVDQPAKQNIIHCQLKEYFLKFLVACSYLCRCTYLLLKVK